MIEEKKHFLWKDSRYLLKLSTYFFLLHSKCDSRFWPKTIFCLSQKSICFGDSRNQGKNKKYFVRETKVNKTKLYWWETDKLTKFSKKIKSLNVLDTLLSAGCTKSSKFEKVMVAQTHGDDRENGGFFLFFRKNSNLVQNKKNPPFSLSSPCVWAIITFSNLELLVHHSNFLLFWKFC